MRTEVPCKNMLYLFDEKNLCTQENGHQVVKILGGLYKKGFSSNLRATEIFTGMMVFHCNPKNFLKLYSMLFLQIQLLGLEWLKFDSNQDKTPLNNQSGFQFCFKKETKIA